MRIVILANSDIGLYKFRKELISELLVPGSYIDGRKAAPCEVFIVLPNGDYVNEFVKMGCTFIDTPVERRGMNPVKDFSLLMNYFKIIKKEKPDLVITYTIKPNIYGGTVCYIKRIPYVANITGLGTAFEGKGFLRKMVTVMYKLAVKNAKAVFFENSGNMQVFLNENIISRNQAVLLNGAGVNLERYSVLSYPQNNDEIKFLFIGRVMAEKGVNELFEAMRKLRNDAINCSLDMLGSFDENYEQEIWEAEAEGWMRYHGYQSDVRPFIAACDCFVLPSYHEGMANTNLECASSGRPVITSNIPGCREAVIDGVSGLLCAPKSVESLYKAMKRMTGIKRDERILMGFAGRKHMEEVFNKQKVIEETIKYLC